MKKIGKIKSFVAGGLVALALAVSTPVRAESKNYADFFLSEKEGMSHVKVNQLYSLPGNIRSYSYVELYADRYFGKSMLSKSLSDIIALRMDVFHINEPFTSAGLGLGITVPLPKDYSASFRVLPLWFDKKGNYIPDKVVVRCDAGFKPGSGWSLNAFGEVNVAAKEGPVWGYGELQLAKEISDDVMVKYNIALRSKGELAPQLENRIGLSIKY